MKSVGTQSTHWKQCEQEKLVFINFPSKMIFVKIIAFIFHFQLRLTLILHRQKTCSAHLENTAAAAEEEPLSHFLTSYTPCLQPTHQICWFYFELSHEPLDLLLILERLPSSSLKFSARQHSVAALLADWKSLRRASSVTLCSSPTNMPGESPCSHQHASLCWESHPSCLGHYGRSLKQIEIFSMIEQQASGGA